MKQQPSRIFYKKPHKPSKFVLSSIDQKRFFLTSGVYGLKSLENGKLNYKQIEAGRKTIRRTVSKQAFILIKPFTSVSLTKKGLGLRMGKGKGSHHIWISPILKGQIIYEVRGATATRCLLALKKAADKMPFNCAVTKLIY